MFIAALLTMAEMEKRPKCPSVDEQVHTMQGTAAGRYDSAVRKERTLSRGSQAQVTHCMIPFIGNFQHRQIHRNGKQIYGCRELDGDGEE